ncbi:DUF3833 family protein [Consotaella aegiceratis]|uniref:DUF3833 family protein n=1 Tax=Consotaella aegiceratis TaxID=3097961 RepID=UPI002F3F7EAB
MTGRRAVKARLGRTIAASVGLLGIAIIAAAPPPASAADPGFTLEGFFEGQSFSRGQIRTLGLFEETFTARFDGRASDGWLDLTERFTFEDGDRVQRWRLHRVASDRYRGTVRTETSDGSLSAASPVVGRLTPAGAVLTYDGFAPGGDTHLHFRHEMEAEPDGTVQNHVTISKLGIPLAFADVVFAKDPARLPPPARPSAGKG